MIVAGISLGRPFKPRLQPSAACALSPASRLQSQPSVTAAALARSLHTDDRPCGSPHAGVRLAGAMAPGAAGGPVLTGRWEGHWLQLCLGLSVFTYVTYATTTINANGTYRGETSYTGVFINIPVRQRLSVVFTFKTYQIFMQSHLLWLNYRVSSTIALYLWLR